MPGRPKKPTAVKKAQGTAQPCRMQKNEMLPALFEGIPSPPEEIKGNKKAAMLWVETVNELKNLNMLHSVDLGMLGAYCITLANYYKYNAYCEKHGHVNEKTDKRRAQDIVRRDLLEQAIKLANSFGFTPQARTKISMPEKPKDNNLFDD